MNQPKAYGPGASAGDIPGVNVNANVLAGEPVLFGRQAECEILDRLAASARAGRGGALVVRGEPGAGKTALLDYLARRAGGFLVVSVGGDRVGAGLRVRGPAPALRPAVEPARSPGRAAAQRLGCCLR